MSIRHEEDRAAWALEQGRLLRGRAANQIDTANIAEEVERLGCGDAEILRERVRILLVALLRWAYQADLRSVALSSTIMGQRHAIDSLLQDSEGLRRSLDEFVIETYPEAKRRAVLESALFDESFPEGLPFLPHEVFDPDFLPDPLGDDKIPGDD